MSGGGIEAWTQVSEGGKGCKTPSGGCAREGGGTGKDCKSPDWFPPGCGREGGSWFSMGGGGK